MTPGSAVRLASVARHVTDCATRPGTMMAIHLHAYRGLIQCVLAGMILEIHSIFGLFGSQNVFRTKIEFITYIYILL